MKGRESEVGEEHRQKEQATCVKNEMRKSNSGYVWTGDTWTTQCIPVYPAKVSSHVDAYIGVSYSNLQFKNVRMIQNNLQTTEYSTTGR